MSSVQHLREFISERLTAAAEEIFTEFEKTIVQYEEEIDRQRRLLDITWNPQIKLIRTDVPQQHDCREKEVVSDQQLFKQETDVGLDQEGEPLVLRVQTDLVVQCKSEPEEPLTGLEKTCIQYEEEAHRPQIQLHSTDNIMLIKAKINKEQKYVKISKPSLEEFLSSAFVKFSIVPPVRESVRVYDETGTEVDADVFEEVVQQPSAGVFTITCDRASQGGTQGAASTSPVPEVMTNPLAELSRCNSKDTIIQDEDYSPPCKQPKIKWMEIPARNLVEFALTKKPGGEQIIKEYVRTKGLTDSSRRKLVKILTAHMAGIHGTAPPRRVREMYAQGIVEMFPSLRDPYSKNGYEHFYDGESGSGYLAWRLKTIQRKDKSSEGRGSSCQLTGGGPTARRDASLSPEVTLSQEQCKEAITFMKHSSDEATIKHKMKMTFGYRRKMVLDKEKSSDVLTEFPRFKDVKGLIEQDFILEFGEDIASKFLERWPAIFRQKIIQQSKTLISSSDLQELICCAEGASNNEGFEETLSSGWDRDLASIMLLLHLIPPSCQGRKRPGKVSASQAEKHLVVFQESGSSIKEHADAITSSAQPYLLAVGTKRSSIHQFFIVLNKHLIPCSSTSSLGAFDELFKAHFVFGTVYNQKLHNMYTFIQTTVYNIDVGRVQETPRVAEIRSRLLN